MSAKTATTFTSRGRLRGLIRDASTTHTGRNRARAAPEEQGTKPVDEATYYRARLILGESLPRPGR